MLFEVSCTLRALGFYVLLAYAAWFIYSLKFPHKPGRALRWLWRPLTFSLRSLGPLLSVKYKVVFKGKFTEGKPMGWPYYNETRQAPQSIFSWHPHSALTVLPFTFFQSAEVFGREVFIGIASALCAIPGLREIMIIGNCRIASPENTNSILEHGHSLMMQPGGVHEQLNFTDDHEIAYFSSNLGFLRAAVKFGVPVVPMYSFGENQLYRRRPDRVKISKFLSRLGIPTPAASGLFGSPAGLFCLPGNPLLVVGESIPVEKVEATDEDAAVGQLFKTYLAAIREIWDEHCNHLPSRVREKGLRFVYRPSKDPSAEVISDTRSSDESLVGAFAAEMAKRRQRTASS